MKASHLFRALADPLIGPPIPDEAKLHATAVSEASKAAKIVPPLLGSKDEAWNGKASIYRAQSKPHIEAELDWDGTMNMADNVAAALADARDHPDQPVKNPDAFEVVEHEMIHGVVPPGTQEASKKAYQDYAHAQIEEGFTELGAIHHAPDFLDQMGIGSRESGTWRGHTVREMAVSMQNPAEIANGNAWGHYAGQVKDAQDWVQQIAKEEGYADTGPGTPGHTRVVQLTDQVNRVGASEKMQAMAVQMALSVVKDEQLRANLDFMASITSSIQEDIQREWSKGEPETAKTAFATARNQVQTQMMRAMQERAAA
jgi:hypothetical protein